MAPRTLTLNIFRFEPNDRDSIPKMQAYKIEELPGLNMYAALTTIRETLDPSLKFDFVCRASICGSCAMVINGKARLACQTLTKDLPEEITIQPLPVFKMLGDLCVDTGTWFRETNTRIGSWVHTSKDFVPGQQELRMDNEVALQIYEVDRCIECGVCVAACATAQINGEFAGATTFVKIARFMSDPRDERKAADYYDVIGTDDGIFGCIGLMGCEDNCPKEIPIQKQLYVVRRKMAWTGIFG